ncbi:MAG: hypothetical protein IKU65_04495 [Oscillospiraceae bacterium]|nr:hypothetical protein [Oscillospiraceae bacterium]
MKKPYIKVLVYVTVAILISILILLFLFPDMSQTLINTVPEYPPEISTIDANEILITNAVTIDKSNVRDIISAMNRPEEYYSETQGVITHNTGSSSFTRKKWVRGSLSRVDVLSDAQRTTAHYIYTDDKVYIFSPQSRTHYTTSRGNFDADDTQMMMSYEDIIKTPDESISDAKLTTLDGNSCIWVEAKNPKTGNTTRYWVATSTGLLLYGETLDPDGKTIYTFTVRQTDVSPQSADIFKLPDGTYPT